MVSVLKLRFCLFVLIPAKSKDQREIFPKEFRICKTMETADANWDVDKYKSDHEPKHHWELRRIFMERNKGRYPEDRLVCLGQVFANIEFTGCR